jgi:hypothetical protein
MAKSYIASRKAIQLKMRKLFQKQPCFAEILSQSAVADCCFPEENSASYTLFILLEIRNGGKTPCFLNLVGPGSARTALSG